MTLMTTGFDPLPEHTRYRDEGCSVYPSCLECPSPRCLEEAPRGKQKALTALRAGEMARRREAGRGTDEIARELGVSRRTVQRALRLARGKEKQ